MAKRVHYMQVSPTPLDGEIERFLLRIGDEGRPLTYVRGYSVTRSMDSPHLVCIEFVADAEFDAPPASALCGNTDGRGDWNPGPCILPAGHAERGEPEHSDGRVHWLTPDARAARCPHGVEVGAVCPSGFCGDGSGTGIVTDADRVRLESTS